MKIFLSWSGDTSREIAEVFYDWLPCVLQQTKPFFSEEIEKGARSLNSISSELESCSSGLLFLTKDNLTSPWIMFEAGALSRVVDDRKVCPILFGVKKSDVEYPLKQFQFTLFLKSDIQRLITDINDWSGDRGVSSSLLSTTFDKLWPDLDKTIKEILKRKREKLKSFKEILQAFDEEKSRFESGNNFIQRVTGTKLAQLGEFAVLEKGELDVAIEAFMCLLRLSNMLPGNFAGKIINPLSSIPTPALSTIKLLSIMQQDQPLIIEAVRRAKTYALIGDADGNDLYNYSKIPNDSWKTVVDIFYHYTKFGDDEFKRKGWNGGAIMMSLTELLVGLGIVYTQRELELPDPPKEIRITSSDERGVEPGQSEELFPYVYLANKIAMLPKGDFDFALNQLKYYRHPITQVIVEPENNMVRTLEQAKKEIFSWGVSQGQANIFIVVGSDESKNECLKLIQELQEIGQKVSDSTKAFLIGERDCAVNQSYFREQCSSPYGYEVNMETDSMTFEP